MNLDDIKAALELGEIDLEGQFLWGSNYTLLVKICHAGMEINAVYKPDKGVRPLWDFASYTLSRREVAAYQVSETLGWNLVPPTIFRKSAPHGPGSVQYFVEHDPEYHFFNFSEGDRQRLRPVVLFDIIINNADRKGGHLIFDQENNLWLIDHGICFHEEPKLRTVVWDFAGEPLPEDLCTDIERLQTELVPGTSTHVALEPFLAGREIAAMKGRAASILARGTFPHPPRHSRPYPWPLV